MIRNFLLFSVLLISFSLHSQKYTTPGTGVHWTLDSLVEISLSTVSFSDAVYTIHEELELAVTDTLVLRPGDHVLIDSALAVRVSGVFLSQGSEGNEVVIDAVDSLKPYNGFRFEDVSTAVFDYSIVKNGGGLKLITENVKVTNSQFLYNTKGTLATGAVLDLSYGSPLITNNRFIRNAKPAVSSPANRTVSAKIINNYLEGNNQLNENRPQLNMGTTGKDTLVIKGNVIIGDRTKERVGAIAVSNLLNSPDGIVTVIEDNTMRDNRYGMTIAGGNAYALIKDNVIEDNDTEGKPNLGGSGISLNAGANTQDIIITGNEIRRNLWGITIIGQASANLGDDSFQGNNIFSENGNDGVVYALYNNTANTISAKGNCWIEGKESTLEEAGKVIFDVADDSKLGEVVYDPILCGVTVATEDITSALPSFYPNPAHDRIYFAGIKDIKKVNIISLDGRKLYSKDINENTEHIQFNLLLGIYIVEFENVNQKFSQKLIVE
ncbi:MAG TPA: T9SS type A sorting domain-containing protein [Saprospiraceae bacterium]|jgi:hypothetical protein|nr:T9SS type A sorting domain-containing protein [Saprospiraceae bacterium]HRO09505.1 T9SS type A sorting domain-containing protein [Saprospiraceae bacterium]HRP42798.1 T9SS type A sorting domain-containing protein [Saprospiraceae bacterium]